MKNKNRPSEQEIKTHILIFAKKLKANNLPGLHKIVWAEDSDMELEFHTQFAPFTAREFYGPTRVEWERLEQLLEDNEIKSYIEELK
jgi:hypothetical protein